MTVEELLKSLDINGKIEVDGADYFVDLKNSNNYSYVYSVLDKSELVDLIPEYTVMTMDESKLVYTGDDYVLTLSGDLENNVYKLLIEEK